MPNSDKPPRPRLRRDAGGMFELREGTGGITAMCPVGTFLEIYKEDTTFRVRSPETVDPARTNPNALWVASVSDGTVGSSSPVVARVFLQGREILNSAIFAGKVDKDGVVQQLHACKEAVVICEKAAARVASQVDQIVAKLQSAEDLASIRDGKFLNPFPQVPELESEVTAFLIHAKRAIEAICRLAPMFIDVPPKDSNFDWLAKTLMAAGFGEEIPLTKFVLRVASRGRYLVDLRNGQEHPKDERPTIIRNFSVTPDGAISMPLWHRTGEPPCSIREEMRTATDFLIDAAEAMLIHLVLHSVDTRYPFFIQKLDDSVIDPKSPIRYRLSLDLSKMENRTPTPPPKSPE